MIRSGAAASRQIGARPAADKRYTLTEYIYFVGFFIFSESEKNLTTNLGRQE
nr:MAG TPA: hypothetical protein [Bacteriophage sp.]